MRKLLIALIVLMPITASAGNTTKVDELQAAEEDICIAQAEYSEAKTLFYSETSGMVDMNSPQARLATDYKRKRLRYGQLLQRYYQKYGKQFDGFCTASGSVYHLTEAEKEAISRATTIPPTTVDPTASRDTK